MSQYVSDSYIMANFYTCEKYCNRKKADVSTLGFGFNNVWAIVDIGFLFEFIAKYYRFPE